MKAMISVKKNCSAKNAAGNLKKIEIAKKSKSRFPRTSWKFTKFCCKKMKKGQQINLKKYISNNTHNPPFFPCLAFSKIISPLLRIFWEKKIGRGRTPLPGQCQPLWELLFSPSLPESPVYKLVLQISPGLSAWITKNTNVHINYFGQCLKVTGFEGFSSSVSMNSVAQSASRWTEVVSEKPEWVIVITFFSEGTLICSDIKC